MADIRCDLQIETLAKVCCKPRVRISSFQPGFYPRRTFLFRFCCFRFLTTRATIKLAAATSISLVIKWKKIQLLSINLNWSCKQVCFINLNWCKRLMKNVCQFKLIVYFSLKQQYKYILFVLTGLYVEKIVNYVKILISGNVSGVSSC